MLKEKIYYKDSVLSPSHLNLALCKGIFMTREWFVILTSNVAENLFSKIVFYKLQSKLFLSIFYIRIM